MLSGKRILVGITGSIAAYKSAWLVRLLVQAGAEVKVVMSRGALDFITPLTLSTLSRHPVHSDFTENRESGQWVNHVQLALWADLMVVAPATANTIAKMASGQCDSFLMAVYMSARCPVMVAPAMDHDMLLHPGTTVNLEKLSAFGHQIIQTQEGPLASGIAGKGRMAEAEEIYQRITHFFHPAQPLAGIKVLLTSGPTHEYIDPVRYIGNRSSGKMGVALANELVRMGAHVVMVSGPAESPEAHPSIEVVKVTSALEMLAACEAVFPQCRVAIMAAAVADFRPVQRSAEKIKKEQGIASIELTENPDIAVRMGQMKTASQILVGFALETGEGISHAVEKLKRKNLDFIALNKATGQGAALGSETSRIILIWPDNKQQDLGLMRKQQHARTIAEKIAELVS